MSNKVKCKLCGDIIESTNKHYITCKCGEVSVDGCGEYLRIITNDFDNVLGIDKEGKEYSFKVIDKEETKENMPSKPTVDDLLAELNIMIKNIENLPSTAMLTPINHYDFAASLILLAEILRELRSDQT